MRTNLICKEEAPAYRAELFGPNTLSDAELLSIILYGETRNPEQIERVKDLLAEYGGNIRNLQMLNVHDLKSRGFNGTSARLIAAVNFAARLASTPAEQRPKISCSRDAYDVLRPYFAEAGQYEHFYCLILNKANKVLRVYKVSEGGVSGTVVDPKRVYKAALDLHASSIILAHNHPSGNLTPSVADQKITQKLRDAGIMLDIAVLDHIICCSDGYYSFADEGIL